VCGALYQRTAPSTNACKPAGEWQTFDIVFVGRRLTVRHNNQKILDNIDVGLKGTGLSSEREDAPGPCGFRETTARCLFATSRSAHCQNRKGRNYC
jgi:hypothetical protein